MVVSRCIGLGRSFFPFERCIDVLNDRGYEGFLCQGIIGGRYMDDSVDADFCCFHNFVRSPDETI